MTTERRLAFPAARRAARGDGRARGYGGPEGFEQVLDLVEAHCRNLLRELI
ncbi:MAG: hypothetical protein K0R40_3740, partial [Burkholderiales bacterium]|nr:hypothetical protein [Burkholderiales bacterium]